MPWGLNCAGLGEIISVKKPRFLVATTFTGTQTPAENVGKVGKMTPKDNLDEQLDKLSQAIASDDNLVENVMSRINSASAAGDTGAGRISTTKMTTRYTSRSLSHTYLLSTSAVLHQYRCSCAILGKS